MKIIPKSQFNYSELTNQKSGEMFSASAVVSQLLESNQLFIHHDVISPGKRSSGPHYHSLCEEVVLITQGSATVIEGQTEVVAEEGTLVLFDPKEKELHFLTNRTDQNVETITFSRTCDFDSAIFEHLTEDIKMPGSHFDKDLKDVPDNVNEWLNFWAEQKAKLKTETHAAKKLALFELIGMAARILQQFDESEFYLKKALTLSYSYPRQNRLIQNLIRLAHVYQWRKEFEKSLMLFDQAKSLLDEDTTSEILRAAFHQHLGKLYFDQGYFGKAQAEFSTALSIREKKSAPLDQIKSSKDSLNEALIRWGRNFSAVSLRKATQKDAQAIHDCHMKSIQEVCVKDHSPEEILAWGHRPFNQQQRINTIRNHLVWVIEENGSIEGYGHLKIYEKDGIKLGHILGLYLTVKVLGKSLGKSIVALMLEELRFVRAKQVSLESTITAHRFYRKLGFIDSGPATTISIGDMPVRCHPMKLDIE